MQDRQKRYIPALSFGWLTRFFGVFVRLTRERTFKLWMIETLSVEKGARILDIGCGTGTLAIMAKRAYPGAEVVGLDGDATILAEAHRSADKSATDVDFVRGMAYAPPYVDGSFDVVLSRLVFHHLASDDKVRTLQETRRILRPGGKLLVADLGKPGNPLMYAISMVMRQLEEAAEGIQGRLPAMIEDAGFVGVTESHRFMTVFGSLSIYRATNPAVPEEVASHCAQQLRRQQAESVCVNAGS